MQVLIIGGTRFVGWHIVAACLRRGHAVTLLNRGHSEPGQWPGLPRLTVDRRTPGQSGHVLQRRVWDLVIDCCAYAAPDLAIVELLRDRTEHYTLISSCAVHDPSSAAGKRDCERGVAQIMSNVPLLIPRLGLTVGYRDLSGRLLYWLERGRTGGDALVPMEPTQPLRLIDVRDLAAFVVDAASAQRTGTPDVLGPCTTVRDLLALIARLTGDRVRWHWISESLAKAEGLRPWTQIPLWIPATNTAARALMTREPANAVATSLRCRSLEETVTDCLAWCGVPGGCHAGWLDPAVERRVIDHYHLARQP